jgi:hypothetical protein
MARSGADKLQSMVRRDGMVGWVILVHQGITCCASSVGASPAPVSVGAPGSRPQVWGETFMPERGVKSP